MAEHDEGRYLLSGPGGVVPFNSYDEMMEYERANQEAAIANMTASQRAIPLGGYALRYDLAPVSGIEYGVLWSVEELTAWNHLYYAVGDLEAARAVLAERGEFSPPRVTGDGSPEKWTENGYASVEEAIADEVDRTIRSHERGYLYGWWRSEMFPEGSLTDAHASVCVEITREQYLEAKEHGWRGVGEETARAFASAVRTTLAEQIKAREGETEGEGDDDTDGSTC